MAFCVYCQAAEKMTGFAASAKEKMQAAKEASEAAAAKAKEAQEAAAEGSMGARARKLKEEANRLKEEARKKAQAAREVRHMRPCLRVAVCEVVARAARVCGVCMALPPADPALFHVHDCRRLARRLTTASLSRVHGRR